MTEELTALGLLDPEEAEGFRRSLNAGGSHLAHLQRLRGSELSRRYEQAAAHQGQVFYPDPASVGPIDVGLLSMHHALDYLILPRMRKFKTIELLTCDPLLRETELSSLLSSFTPFIPGGTPSVTLVLITPDCYRELFKLCYPAYNSQRRGVQDDLALTSLIPAASNTVPTNRDLVLALAKHAHLPFIDLTNQPPDALIDLQFNLAAFTEKRLFPHHMDQRGVLIVLGAAETPMELDRRIQHVQELSLSMLQPMQLALAHHTDLLKLLCPPQEDFTL